MHQMVRIGMIVLGMVCSEGSLSLAVVGSSSASGQERPEGLQGFQSLSIKNEMGQPVSIAPTNYSIVMAKNYTGNFFLLNWLPTESLASDRVFILSRNDLRLNDRFPPRFIDQMIDENRCILIGIKVSDLQNSESLIYRAALLGPTPELCFNA